MTAHTHFLSTDRTEQTSFLCTSASPSLQLHFTDEEMNEGFILTGFGQPGHFFAKFECSPHIYLIISCQCERQSVLALP